MRILIEIWLSQKCFEHPLFRLKYGKLPEILNVVDELYHEHHFLVEHRQFKCMHRGSHWIESFKILEYRYVNDVAVGILGLVFDALPRLLEHRTPPVRSALQCFILYLLL